MYSYYNTLEAAMEGWDGALKGAAVGALAGPVGMVAGGLIGNKIQDDKYGPKTTKEHDEIIQECRKYDIIKPLAMEHYAKLRKQLQTFNALTPAKKIIVARRIKKQLQRFGNPQLIRDAVKIAGESGSSFKDYMNA